MQVEIQLFFKRELDSSFERKCVSSLGDLLAEISVLKSIDNLSLLINVGGHVEARQILKLWALDSFPSKIILTESAFLALSDFFEISSCLTLSNHPYYETSFYGVVGKIFDRITSSQMIDKKQSLLDGLEIGVAEDGLFAKGISKTWLKDYIIHHPEDSDLLKRIEIIDDISYQQFEDGLSKEIREKLGRHRLYFLYDLLDNTKIENIISILPPWVLKSLIKEYLIIDVRCQNCLASQNILKFNDLLNYSDETLLRVPNLGRSSYTQIRSKLEGGIEFFIKSQQISFSQENFIQSSLDCLYQDIPKAISGTGGSGFAVKGLLDLWEDIQTKYPTNIKSVDTPVNIELNSLIETLNYFASSEINKSKYQQVLNYRLGIKSKPKSLQEVGELIGVSRERVRQIEKKLLKKFSSKYRISEKLEKKLDDIRLGLSIPLSVSGLSIYDPWFKGIEETPWLLGSMLSAFNIGRYRVHNFENELIIAPGENDLIENSIKAVRDFIQDRIESGLTKSQILDFTNNFVGIFTPELVDTIFYGATKNVVFDLTANDSPVIAISSRLVAALTTLLQNSPKPLKCDELVILLKDLFDFDAELNYVRNTCSTNFFQYAPSTFGLLGHSLLSLEEMTKITDAVYEIILDKGETKQWHCDKLLDLLIEEDSFLEDKLDKYKLRICLLRSDKFIDLGRMVFIIKTDGVPVSGIKRIEFAQFVEAILEKSEVPIHRDAIYKIIERDRGLGDCAQIFHSGRLISTAPGVWGVMDKHLNLSDLDFRDIVSDLVLILKNKQFSLTESELLNEITEASKAFRFKKSPYVLFSLGVKSKLCRREDIYLSLSEWDDCRRPTLKDSINKALEQVPSSGMKLVKILEIAEEYYQHSIDRPYVNKVLIDNNFAYDEENQVWKRVLG